MTRKSKWGFMLNSSSPYKIFLSDLVYGFPFGKQTISEISRPSPEHTCGRGELSEPVDIRITHL